jgi:hypothetical protein
MYRTQERWMQMFRKWKKNSVLEKLCISIFFQKPAAREKYVYCLLRISSIICKFCFANNHLSLSQSFEYKFADPLLKSARNINIKNIAFCPNSPGSSKSGKWKYCFFRKISYTYIHSYMYYTFVYNTFIHPNKYIQKCTNDTWIFFVRKLLYFVCHFLANIISKL